MTQKLSHDQERNSREIKRINLFIVAIENMSNTVSGKQLEMILIRISFSLNLLTR